MSVRSSLLAAALLLAPAAIAQGWSQHGGNAQHTALSAVASQALQTIRWSAPVDLDPQYTANGNLLAHYGSPVVTNNNTVLIPVKTGATGGFKIQARNGGDGSILWEQTSDYVLPTHQWVPSYNPTITTTGRLAYAGAAGTVYFRDNLDAPGAVTPTQIAFYSGPLSNNIRICTPLTSDSFGNIYFGFRAGTNTLGLTHGIARIGVDGSTSFLSASDATGGLAPQMLMNCAPAISNDGKTLYFAAKTNVNFGVGYLVAVDATTLAFKNKVLLKDPLSGNDAFLVDNGTASPMIAPDGKVFFGVLENPFSSARGWMLSFDADLNPVGAPGGFGWDITPSVVPASLVPSYTGTSEYLLMTKYNSYPSRGGDGVNKLAILDPNDTQIDSRTGATIMKEVLTIAGVTPDPAYLDTHPNAVREWCINTAVVDPFTKSVLVNSEDGKLYRWDLTTNTFTEAITLTGGIGEAYTPTTIGRDGKVYAINNATLFAVGAHSAPEPGTLALIAAGVALAPVLRRRQK